jgi:hypothetical protein
MNRFSDFLCRPAFRVARRVPFANRVHPNRNRPEGGPK